MSIEAHYTATLTVSRMVWDTDVDENEFSELDEVGTISGHIQQANMQLAQHLGLSFTKTFTIWCALDANVEEGDQLAYDGYIYHVKAKQTFENGHNAHIELHCERELVGV